MTGHDLPHLVTSVPGPRSRGWVDRLALRECPAITARRARRAALLGRADDDPPVWIAARGCNVEDVDGNVLVDLTAGFGAALVGHAHPDVVVAAQDQVQVLPHAMGDAFFHPGRVQLLERIADLVGLDRAILGCSGSDAVDAALKTARMATGRDRVLAFEGSYHGLASSVLAATAFMAPTMRAPFEGMLGRHVTHVPFGGDLPPLEEFAAVLLEPIQGRGGVNVPPAGWLPLVADRARNAGALLVLDEIFTGLGRCGAWSLGRAWGVTPDLLCIGKGLADGFPISACVGRAEVMDAWGASMGPALHTQTFLGNPVGCAMALATLDVLEREDLPSRAAAMGVRFQEALKAVPGVREVRGRGLLVGAVLRDGRTALAASRALLQRGWIVLPAGEKGDVLEYTPPLTIPTALLDAAVDVLAEVLGEGV